MRIAGWLQWWQITDIAAFSSAAILLTVLVCTSLYFYFCILGVKVAMDSSYLSKFKISETNFCCCWVKYVFPSLLFLCGIALSPPYIGIYTEFKCSCCKRDISGQIRQISYPKWRHETKNSINYKKSFKF